MLRAHCVCRFSCLMRQPLFSKASCTFYAPKASASLSTQREAFLGVLNEDKSRMKEMTWLILELGSSRVLF